MVLFLLRLAITVAVFGFVWTLVKPKTQLMRVVRAALLVLCLLVALMALRIAGAG